MKIKINPVNTAVVVIDLQKGITSMPAEPHASETVINNTVRILESSRRKGITVCLVRVAFNQNFKDALHPITEVSFQTANRGPDWSDYVPQLNIQPEDILITKHQWGAFYGTEIDLQLRRRSIDTIILCGISTNFGVESTARFAYEYGYNLIFVEDAISARSKEEHNNTFKYIFPRLGLSASTEDVVEEINNCA